MFEIGASEIVLILIIALLVMGPQNLPKVARAIGKVTGQIRRITNEFKDAIEDEVKALEIEELKKKRQANMATEVPAPGPGGKDSPGVPTSEIIPPAAQVQKIDPAADVPGSSTVDPYGLGPEGEPDPDWSVIEENPAPESENGGASSGSDGSKEKG